MEEKKLTDEKSMFNYIANNILGAVKPLYLRKRIIGEILDLIHRLQSEKKELQESAEWFNDFNEKLNGIIEGQKVEIERLTEENKHLDTLLEEKRWEEFSFSKKIVAENAELQKQVDDLKDERENMQAEILRFEDMKFTQEHCDLYSENETLKQWLKRLNADLENEKNWGKIQTKQAVKDTAKEIFQKLYSMRDKDQVIRIEMHNLQELCDCYGVEVE